MTDLVAGHHVGAIHSGWDINGNANGGYMMALAARAMRDDSGQPDPISVSAHYLAPGPPGAVTLRTEAVKQGRQLVTMSGSMHQGDRELMRLLGSFGDVAAKSGGFQHTTPHRTRTSAPRAVHQAFLGSCRNHRGARRSPAHLVSSRACSVPAGTEIECCHHRRLGRICRREAVRHTVDVARGRRVSATGVSPRHALGMDSHSGAHGACARRSCARSRAVPVPFRDRTERLPARRRSGVGQRRSTCCAKPSACAATPWLSRYSQGDVIDAVLLYGEPLCYGCHSRLSGSTLFESLDERRVDVLIGCARG